MTESLELLFEFSPGGFPAGGLAVSFLFILLALLLRRILFAVLGKVGRTGTGFISSFAVMLKKPAGFLLIVTGAYSAFRIHSLPENITLWGERVLIFLLTVGILWILMKAVDAVAERMREVAEGTKSRMDDQLVPILRKLAKVIIVFVGILFYMQFNGYPVSGIIAGMGIGGLAVALAAQDSIAGIFASVVIFLDKPFMVGDFVEVAGIIGTVEEIGIRSTRIRTIDKTLVTIPNKEIMDSNIDNFSKRPMRRAATTIGVTYDTTPEQMEELLERLRGMLRDDRNVDNETIIVNFTEFGASSLDIDMKYFLLTINYDEWLALREKVNLNVMRIVAAVGLDFAFPSTTVYLEK